MSEMEATRPVTVEQIANEIAVLQHLVARQRKDAADDPHWFFRASSNFAADENEKRIEALKAQLANITSQAPRP